jgi:PAS domain S-box-containing protein
MAKQDHTPDGRDAPDHEVPPAPEDAEALRRENLRLAAELAELREQHDLLVAGAAGAGWEWDVPAGAVAFSPRWAELRGYELPELSDDEAEWSSRIHPADRQRVLDAVLAHFRGETAEFLQEYRTRCKDGGYIWVRDRGVALRDESGAVRRMAGSEVEITPLRETRESLEATLRLLQAAQEMGHVGSWEEDLKTGVERWTDEVFRILGLDPATSEPLVSTFDARVHPDDLPALDEEFDGSLARGDDAYDWTFRIVRRDTGETRWVRDRCRYVRDETGAALRRLGTLQDVTEYRRAQDEIAALNADLERRVERRTADLQAVNRELESFAYAVSHDLRAPLRGIDGFAHVLGEEYVESLDDTALRYLGRIRGNAQKMGELIDGLLVLSRLSRTEMAVRPVDLTHLAHEVTDELASAEPGRTVTTEVAEGLSAEADPALVRVLLANLIGNAWRFTSRHETARIEFGVRDGGGGVERVFFVRDDGAGFDMAHAGLLFTAFQRLHTPGQFEGTGIGLATVQRIVRRHGGRVWAESAVEQGATFFFTLAPSG